MITVTDIFNDKGKLIDRVAKCDCKPWITWKEFFIGILGAFVALWFVVI